MRGFTLIRAAAVLAACASPLTAIRAESTATILAEVQAGSVDAKVVARPPIADAPGVPTVTATPGEQYRAGGLRRWILGDVHRDLWTTALRVPVLDLNSYAGGLKALKAGGGLQTKSLRLVTKDGVEYVFRCLAKDDSFTVPAGLKGSFVADVSRDQVSALHPGAALIVAPLAAAAGVLHATPMLVVMPADADLGEFTKDFAGRLGWIEEYPNKPDGAPGFAGAAEIIDSEKLLEELNKDPGQRIDAPAFLAARMVDMLVGDWDRHPGQWRWARMPGDKQGPWVAIPRDRDYAFVTYDGLVGKVGGLFAPVSAPFGGRSANIGALTWNSLELDRRLLAGLAKPVWDSVAAAVTARITDSVIEAAVGALPPEYRSDAPRLAAALKERRSSLPRLANEFYALLAKVVDIHATDQAERATITRAADGVVDIRVEPLKGPPSFARRFSAAETREIRLYLHGGDDSAVVVGSASVSIPVRVVGGNGNNWLADSATVGGKRNAAHLYDNGMVKGVKYGKDTSFDRRHWEKDEGKSAPPPRDRGVTIVPIVGISNHRGIGLAPRLGVARTVYGFEKRPYASRMELTAAYAFGNRGLRIIATGDQRLETSPVHFTEMARLSWLELSSYHGLGNETADSGTLNDHFAMRHRQLMFRPAVAIALGKKSDFSIGPVIQQSVTDSTPGRFLAGDRPYGFGTFGQAGVQLLLHHEMNSTGGHPVHSLVVNASGTVFPAVWDVKSVYESLSLGVDGVFILPVATRPTLVLRSGGKKLFGDFPFHDAAFVGGNHTARYMEPQRYAGDLSLFGSTELRIPIEPLSRLTPFDFGVVGIGDAGRVWVDGESPGGWHTVVGGGLWLGLRGSRTRVITVTMLTEAGRGGIHIRTGLGF